jgi:hypothetical protein
MNEADLFKVRSAGFRVFWGYVRHVDGPSPQRFGGGVEVACGCVSGLYCGPVTPGSMESADRHPFKLAGFNSRELPLFP